MCYSLKPCPGNATISVSYGNIKLILLKIAQKVVLVLRKYKQQGKLVVKCGRNVKLLPISS